LVLRGTRLITDDAIAAPVRTWLRNRFGYRGRVAYLIGCPWCLSIWIAGAVVPVAYFYGHTTGFTIAGLIGLLSYAAGICATWLDGGAHIVTEED
jgi:hypothetical protein